MLEMIFISLEWINWNASVNCWGPNTGTGSLVSKIYKRLKNIQGHQPQQLHHPLLGARLAVAPWHDSFVSRSHPNDHWTVSHDLSKPEDNNVYTLVITMQTTFKLSSLIHSFLPLSNEWMTSKSHQEAELYKILSKSISIKN